MLLFSSINLLAQDAPPQGFDPAQMRQRRIEQIRQTLDVKEDAEWNALSERITAVMDLRRTERSLADGGGFGGTAGRADPGALSRDAIPRTAHQARTVVAGRATSVALHPERAGLADSDDKWHLKLGHCKRQ